MVISYVVGKIVDLEKNSVTVLTSSGVGYELLISESTYFKIALSEDQEFYVYHHISENSQNLFGFLEKDERLVFKELIKISGIGGKVALLILSLGITNLFEAVALENNKMIEGVKGIGKKMAEKIILELKDKKFEGLEISAKDVEKRKTNIDQVVLEDIKQTLLNMGYIGRDIDRVLSQIPEDLKDTGKIITYALKNI